MSPSLLDITNIVTASFAGVAAITFSAPNHFFSPYDGLLPVLFHRTYYDDSRSLDPITYLFFRCAAAESATVCLAYFLRVLGSFDDEYKLAYSRICFCIHFTMLPLCIQNALDTSGIFVRSSFVWQAAFNATMIFLIWIALKSEERKPHIFNKEKRKKMITRSPSALKYDQDTVNTQNAANRITAIFVGSYALPAYLMPNEFYGPDGVYPLFHKTTQPLNELDSIEIFAMRVMASCISYAVLQNHYLTSRTPSLLNKMNCVTNMFLLHPIMEEARSNNGWSVRWTFVGFCGLILILRYIQFRAAGFFDTIGQPAAASTRRIHVDVVERSKSAQI